jgi:hypothetical protein
VLSSVLLRDCLLLPSVDCMALFYRGFPTFFEENVLSSSYGRASFSALANVKRNFKIAVSAYCH